MALRKAIPTARGRGLQSGVGGGSAASVLELLDTVLAVGGRGVSSGLIIGIRIPEGRLACFSLGITQMFQSMLAIVLST